MITAFSNLYDKQARYATPEVIFEIIKSGGKQKDLIQQIRGTQDKEARNELKKQLGVILFGGKFRERRASELLAYSKLVCLDFDNVKNVDVKKNELSLNPHVFATWVSPSGSGVKAVIRVSSDNHLGHFLALSKEFTDLDLSGKDVCRATFTSYDPNIIVNHHADIYTKIVENAYSDSDKYGKLKAWLDNKGEKFINGNRNNFIAKLAGACNRFGIPLDLAKEYLTHDFVKNESDFSIRELQITVNSIYTNYKEQYNTASFDETFSEARVTDILSSEVKVSSDIITASDVKGDLDQDYDVGMKGGETTYFPELDNHFKFMKGELTTLSGVANMGKTSMLTQLLLFRSVFLKQKSIFLSMEQYPPVFFYRELIRALVGKPIERNNPNRMSKQEWDRAYEFINEYFFFLYPEKEDPTPDYTLARFSEAVIKHNVETVVIDPMNSMAHDYKSAGGRDDRYIAQMLNKYQRFSLQNNVHFFLVAHPKGIGKKEDGTYKEPSADEISGGVTFFQRCDNILMFHRPNMPVDFQDPTCTLRSVKIKKQQLNGVPGTSTFNYDRRTGRYYESGFNPLDGFKL